MLIKLQCVIHKLICLNELYKLMKSFFKIQITFRNFGQNPKNIQTNSIRVVTKAYFLSNASIFVDFAWFDILWFFFCTGIKIN